MRRGEDDRRAPLIEQVLTTVRAIRNLAFILESDRVATYKHGGWRAERVTRFENMGYEVSWSIRNAKQHGVARDRPRLWAVGQS